MSIQNNTADVYQDFISFPPRWTVIFQAKILLTIWTVCK